MATKFSLGFALALLPLVGVLAYTVGQVERLATANRTLATVQFSAAIQSLQLIRQLELLEEYAGKYAVSGDPRYVERVREVEEEIDRALAALVRLDLSPQESAAATRLASAWHDLRRALERELAGLPLADDRRSSLAAELARVEGLRQLTYEVVGATRETIARQARAASEASSSAERVSWAIAALALGVSLLVFFLTFRAINRPLTRLAAGTRAVARGQFSFQLEETGSDELAALSRAFNGMVRDIRKLLRMKSEFVSHVSHELKTPLVAMQETSQLVLDGIPGPVNDRQRRLLELNVAATRRLSGMISDLLELSRSEGGIHYDSRRHDLGALAAHAAAEFEARALEQAVHLDIASPDRPLPLRCDGDRIIQVVQNLLDNALKHTPSGGRVRLRSGLADADAVPEHLRDAISIGSAPLVLLAIEDSGPGLAPTERERVFERFYQAGTNAGGGVGLGLAICREIVRAHGGVIWATDGTLGGARFSVLLPGAAETCEGLDPTSHRASP